MEGQSGKKRRTWNYARKLTAFIAMFQVLSDIIAHGRPVISHFLAFYRSELFLVATAFHLAKGGDDSMLQSTRTQSFIELELP